MREENNGVKRERQSLALYGIILTIGRQRIGRCPMGWEGQGNKGK